MPLADAAEIILPASRAGRGVGAFNVILVEQAEALVQAADREGLPVILQISQRCVTYHGALRPIVTAALEVARAATAPVCVQLDHAESRGLVADALDAGVRAVMFDGSALDYEANVAQTSEVASMCAARGAWLEAELGVVGGKGDAHAPGARTDPAQAAAYVAATGVNALAVAVGTRHRMLTRDARLDLGLISDLKAAVAQPLVLHGSSGVADDELKRAVKAGITKVNIATRLNAVFTVAVCGHLARDPACVDPREYLAAGRQAVAAEAGELLRLLA